MRISKENQRYHFLLFLISPLIGLIYGLKTKQKKYIRWSIFLFMVIYGSTMHPSYLGDGASHFEKIANQPQIKSFSVFWDDLTSILTLSPNDDTAADPYIYILRYVFGTLLNAPRALFIVTSIIFGYFYSGVLVKLMNYIRWTSVQNYNFFIFFLIAFILWYNFVDVQTIRTPLGSWILLYAVISYHQTKKKKYLLLALTPPFFHVGFLALAAPAWVVLFSGFRNPKIYFIIFMVSVLSSNILKPAEVNEYASQTTVGASKSKAYFEDDEIKEQKAKAISERSEKGTRWYKTSKDLSIHLLVLTGLMIFVFIILMNRGFGQTENTLFSYGLATASFANFFNFNYAIYNRAWGLAGVFILALVVIFLSKENLRNFSLSFLKVKVPLFILSLALIPQLLFQLSVLLTNVSVYMIILPPTVWFNYDMGESLRGIIGLFL